MEYAGQAPRWTASSSAAIRSEREFLAFWLREGRVLAGMNVNVWDVADEIEALIAGASRSTSAASPTPTCRWPRWRPGPSPSKEQ